VRAAEEAYTALEEEAALMAEALADVALATTIATADADNSRQQTTINNMLGAKPRLAMAMTEVASWR
jgi:ABC-type sugar transport system substrate-binding protein